MNLRAVRFPFERAAWLALPLAAAACAKSTSPNATSQATATVPSAAGAPAASSVSAAAESSRFAENSSVNCPAPKLPPLVELPMTPNLPDPFLGANGQRITSKSQWSCRRAEIAAQVQEYELGPKPAKPSIVQGALDGTKLTITTGEPGHTVDFAVNIRRPENAPPGLLPALVVVGRSSLIPFFTNRGVAVIEFDNNAMGAQGNQGEGEARTNTRGQGTFYDLYGKDHPASSMMAWAWGVSRVIDALSTVPAANIDVHHLAVSGCSRNGKGALVVGAFDERIALTVGQESGAGGSASWRISQVQMDAYRAANPNAPQRGGQGVQTLASAAGEQPWFRASFAQFGKNPQDVNRLPFDHHMVMGLIAPRGLFVIDNTDMTWLGDESSFTASVAAAEIWKSLGASSAMGASQVGGHKHCDDVPPAQLDELGAFVDKFLLGKEANTVVLRSDRMSADRVRWMPWATPTLL
jgi:hypothetical protein